MTKVEIESKILNKQKMIEKIERRLNKHLADPNADPYDIRHAQYDLKEAYATLAKYREQLRKAESDESLPEIPLIRQFLDKWESSCIAYHNAEIVRYLKAYSLQKEDKFVETLTDSQKDYLSRRIYGRVDNYRIFRKWVEDNVSGFALAHVNYREQCLDADGVKEIAKEKTRKYTKLLRQILAITGDVTDAYGLRIGEQGDINGLVIGTNGKASVNTFGAGGYNIQCFHFRTKVTEIK